MKTEKRKKEKVGRKNLDINSGAVYCTCFNNPNSKKANQFS
jgi:hypothetical protein